MITRPCLIVGATSEIGRAVTARLIMDGRPVALTHSPGALPKNSIECGRRPGYMVQWYAHDVRDPAASEALLARVHQDLVGIPDLVYCAGAMRDRPVALTSDDDWHDVMASNLHGPFYLARALAAKLPTVEDGRLVFISSVAAAKPNSGQANYAAAKGGLEALSRQLAVELGPTGTTSNVVAPGVLEGPMASQMSARAVAEVLRNTPLRQLGRATDVAGIVAWLLSDQGRYVTGQTIRVDGGLTAT